MPTVNLYEILQRPLTIAEVDANMQIVQTVVNLQPEVVAAAIATAADKTSTGADRVQTGLDKTAASTSKDIAVTKASEAASSAGSAAQLLANAGSMLGINFGAFTLVDGELIATHLSTSTVSLVSGELILTYESL